MLAYMISPIIAIVMAAWTYQVVNRCGGKLPWLWAIGALVGWPVVIIIFGIKYDVIAMMVVGIIGLGLIALGIFLAGLPALPPI